MNNDRELLELAAKAAGYSINFEGPVNGFYVNGYDENGDPAAWWNPLEDDGDALRLAVKLKLLVVICRHYVETIWDGCMMVEYGGPIKLKLGDDPYAATRRAIVRASADIGKKTLGAT